MGVRGIRTTERFGEHGFAGQKRLTDLHEGTRGYGPGAYAQRRVNVDFPAWMVAGLDREARRLGVPRQALIKVWIAERLESGGQER